MAAVSCGCRAVGRLGLNPGGSGVRQVDGLTVTSTTGQSHGPPRCVRAGLGPSWWPSAWGLWEGGRVLAVLPGRVDQWSAGGQSAGKAHCMELSDHFQAERSLSQQPCTICCLCVVVLHKSSPH